MNLNIRTVNPTFVHGFRLVDADDIEKVLLRVEANDPSNVSGHKPDGARVFMILRVSLEMLTGIDGAEWMVHNLIRSQRVAGCWPQWRRHGGRDSCLLSDPSSH